MEIFTEKFDATKEKRIVLDEFKRAIGYFNL
jgi:hypothetical protein